MVQKRKTAYIISILILALVLLGAWKIYYFVKNSTCCQGENNSVIKTSEEESCKSKNGIWIPRGDNPFCSLPTSDNGKICKNSNECEGSCMGDRSELTSEQLKKINSGELMNKLGQCSPYSFGLGCELRVEDGEWVEICVD